MAKKARSGESYVAVLIPRKRLNRIMSLNMGVRLLFEHKNWHIDLRSKADVDKEVERRPSRPASLPEFDSFSDDEVAAFAELFVRFALDVYGRGERKTVAHCIVYVSYRFICVDRPSIATALMEAAKQDDNALAYLKRALGVDDWEVALKDFLEEGKLANLGDLGVRSSAWRRDNKEFLDRFHTWLSDQSLPTLQKKRLLKMLSLVTVALLMMGTTGAAEAATTTVAAAAKKASASAKILVALGALVACVMAIVFLTPTCDPRPRSKREVPTAAPGAAPTSSDVRDPGRARAGINKTPVSDADANGSEPGGSVGEAPFFQIMSLSQNVAFVRVPGEAPKITRQGWEDYSDVTSVPPEHQEQWRRVQGLDRRAAQEAREGKYAGALETYRELTHEKNRPGGWKRFAGGIDVDQYLATALSRRARLPAPALFYSGFDGPSVLGLTQYESGRLLEDNALTEQALAAYASCVWRGVVVSPLVRKHRAANWAASNWKDLEDISSVYGDARIRARRLAAELSSRQRAVVSDGLAVWFTGSNFVGASIDPSLPEACAAKERGPDHPEFHMGQQWYLSTELDGVSESRHNLAHLDSSIALRSATLPKRPTRMALAIHRSLRGGPQSCTDLTTAVRFCFMPDGRLVDEATCP